ncbi:GNAT family N-acetyltransferase [Leifsonia sp. LS1]|uniref:GNAT family N-acetyltransferase n=1 Tax=Leifsonia sp. LS1 TaxID=2828483 RepID=UPI001CFE80B8|nr:GNAT family N-acetyltransferase [Leifsonia sp. LS1]
MTVEIRPASSDDHADLLAIWRRAVEATHDFLTAVEVDWYEGMVAGYLPQMTDLRVAVSAPSAEPLGFIAQDDGEIHMLFVDPVAHGSGIGTALLETIAAEHPILRVDVNEDNQSGRTFYAAKGFVQTGRSELDGEGRAHPLLHLRRASPDRGQTDRESSVVLFIATAGQRRIADQGFVRVDRLSKPDSRHITWPLRDQGRLTPIPCSRSRGECTLAHPP